MQADEKHADESVITQIQPGLLEVPPRVLIVDDDEIMIERMRDLVAGAGFEVISAPDGATALQTLHDDFAPIVILDRNMPGMDGITLCKTIRATPYPGYVYIMLVTAQDSEEEILAGLEAGADDYLSKRASSTQLVARLATARRIITLEHSLKQVIEERRRMAMTDPLTGAHNRRYFMNQLRRELKRSRRFGNDISLVVFDLDHFKHVNDRYGHAAGDAVLVEFVRRAQGMLRNSDWCARLGGEEFAVVLPQTDLGGAAVVAEKIRRAVAAMPVLSSEGFIEITVSVGVSGLACIAKSEIVTADLLLGRADDCLYSSKNAGRDRVTIDELPSVLA